MPISRVGARKVPTVIRTLAGFSLLEAILVTVLISFMVALVTPALTSSYRGAVLKSTARSMAANLRHARAAAIGAGNKKVLALNLKTKRVSTLSSTPTSPDESTNSRGRSIAPYIDIYASETSSPDLKSPTARDFIEDIVFEFSPSGSSNGGNLIFAYKNLRYLLEVSPLTGKVKVSVPLDIEVSPTSLMRNQ